MAVFQPSNENEMLLITPAVLAKDFDKGWYHKEMMIYPFKSGKWTMTQLELFLNSLTGFKQPERSRIAGEMDNHRFTLKFTHSVNSQFYVSFNKIHRL